MCNAIKETIQNPADSSVLERERKHSNTAEVKKKGNDRREQCSRFNFMFHLSCFMKKETHSLLFVINVLNVNIQRAQRDWSLPNESEVRTFSGLKLSGVSPAGCSRFNLSCQRRHVLLQLRLKTVFKAWKDIKHSRLTPKMQRICLPQSQQRLQLPHPIIVQSEWPLVPIIAH